VNGTDQDHPVLTTINQGTESMNRSRNTGLWFGAALTLASAATLGIGRADTGHLDFVTHAGFFSAETHQPKILDPHVFVVDSSAPTAVGPQNIQHVAGVRPALIDQDPKTVALVNAKGEALGFNLGDWLAAGGAATIAPAPDGKVQISVQFNHLRPGGHYSLFENHFDQKPVGFTPLDGTAKTNDFVADENGRAELTVVAPQPLTNDNAVLLVYHSDRSAHGAERGDVGVNAHHQLIARVPR
jgi:hypothetical protein